MSTVILPVTAVILPVKAVILPVSAVILPVSAVILHVSAVILPVTVVILPVTACYSTCVNCCTLLKLAIREMGRYPSGVIFRRRKKSLCRLSKEK